MTSVNGVTANPAGVSATTSPDAVSSPAAVSAGAAAGSAADLRGFLDFIASATGGASSGMRAPTNPEDAEALLLLVESKLDKTVSQSRGLGGASRFAQAQAAGATSGASLVTAQKALSKDQSTLTADQTRLSGDVETQSTLQGQVTQLTIDIAAREAAGQGSPPNADDPTLDGLRTELATLQGQLNTITGAVKTDQGAVDADGELITADESRIVAGLNALSQVLSQVATGLRTDVGRDADAAAGASQHRDISYDEVADIAKRHRDGEVARAQRQGAERAGNAATPDEDRGRDLADGYLAAVADALATIRAFAAAPPPTISRTAAAEAVGRLRLAL